MLWSERHSSKAVRSLIKDGVDEVIRVGEGYAPGQGCDRSISSQSVGPQMLGIVAIPGQSTQSVTEAKVSSFHHYLGPSITHTDRHKQEQK